MSTYCISDIHGNARFFEALLSFLPLKDSDTLYILGDVIDRGPDGIKILKYIMNKSNIHLILGNHEVMMLEYLVPSFDSRGKNTKCSSENRSSTKMKMRGR